jgi:hypothetical protein
VSELSLADQIGDKSQVTGEPEVILKLALMGVPPGSNENAPNGLGGDQWRSPRTGLLSRNNFRFARHPTNENRVGSTSRPSVLLRTLQVSFAGAGLQTAVQPDASLLSDHGAGRLKFS